MASFTFNFPSDQQTTIENFEPTTLTNETLNWELFCDRIRYTGASKYPQCDPYINPFINDQPYRQKRKVGSTALSIEPEDVDFYVPGEGILDTALSMSIQDNSIYQWIDILDSNPSLVIYFVENVYPQLVTRNRLFGTDRNTFELILRNNQNQLEYADSNYLVLRQ